MLFAGHAAIALADAQDLNHVATALNGRDVISQAKGILMERYKIITPMALGLLAKTSQDTNRKLYDVAETLNPDRDARPATPEPRLSGHRLVPVRRAGLPPAHVRSAVGRWVGTSEPPAP